MFLFYFNLCLFIGSAAQVEFLCAHKTSIANNQPHQQVLRIMEPSQAVMGSAQAGSAVQVSLNTNEQSSFQLWLHRKECACDPLDHEKHLALEFVHLFAKEIRNRKLDHTFGSLIIEDQWGKLLRTGMSRLAISVVWQC